ncbi:MAG: hypothetical protein ABI691_11225 [Ginsengibacter sp.]
MVAVLAGRRIDAADVATPRFPFQNVEMVKEKLKQFFIARGIHYLVCSAACGADLIALDVAGELNITAKMILPFDVETFRFSSVTDRQGDWGQLFDMIYERLNGQSNVVILNYSEDDTDAYVKTNFDILDTADSIVDNPDINRDEEKIAVIVWEGAPKDSDDTTDHFRKEAMKRNYVIGEINCLR